MLRMERGSVGGGGVGVDGPRVFLLEDDKPAADTFAEALKSRGFSVDVCIDDREAERAFSAGGYDEALIAWKLTTVDGLEICRRLSAKCAGTALILFTQEDEIEAQIAALEGGADDLISKEARPDVLAVRLLAHARRARRSSGSQRCAIRTETGVLAVPAPGSEHPTHNGRPLELTKMERRLLQCPLDSPEPVASAVLLERLWPDATVDAHALHSHISELRRKLQPSGIRLHYVRYRGYRLIRQ
jgi:DNA-binding response OmpR family regulator